MLKARTFYLLNYKMPLYLQTIPKLSLTHERNDVKKRKANKKDYDLFIVFFVLSYMSRLITKKGCKESLDTFPNGYKKVFD